MDVSSKDFNENGLRFQNPNSRFQKSRLIQSKNLLSQTAQKKVVQNEIANKIDSDMFKKNLDYQTSTLQSIMIAEPNTPANTTQLFKSNLSNC